MSCRCALRKRGVCCPGPCAALGPPFLVILILLTLSLPRHLPAHLAPPQGMTAYEPFIMGMLTNFDALPLDRVHNMLKMFVSDPPYDKTLEQLGAYMGRLVADEKLSLDGGTYRKRT